MVKWLIDFTWLTVGNYIFYEVLAILIMWGKSKHVLVSFGGYVFLDWQFDSFFWYIFWASLITLPLAYPAIVSFNYAYSKQGIESASQWIPQIMVWMSAPTAFIIFAYVHGIEPPSVIKVAIIMSLLFLIKIVMMLKI